MAIPRFVRDAFSAVCEFCGIVRAILCPTEDERRLRRELEEYRRSQPVYTVIDW